MPCVPNPSLCRHTALVMTFNTWLDALDMVVPLHQHATVTFLRRNKAQGLLFGELEVCKTRLGIQFLTMPKQEFLAFTRRDITLMVRVHADQQGVERVYNFHKNKQSGNKIVCAPPHNQVAGQPELVF